jgi:hypothetical protein
MTGVNSVGAEQTGTGDWRYKDVEVDLSDVSNIAADDVLIFHSASGGTNPGSMNGGYVVQSVDSGNSRATVRMYYQNTYTNQPSGAVTATVKVIKAVIDFTGAYGFTLTYGSKLRNFADVAVVGDNTTTSQIGFFIGYNSSIIFGSYVPIIQCGRAGIEMEMSYGYFFDAILTSCARPIYLKYSYVRASRVYMTNGGFSNVSDQSHAVLTSSYAYNNDFGFYASDGGFINASSVTNANNGTNFSPAVNTPGNNEAYIKN